MAIMMIAFILSTFIPDAATLWTVQSEILFNYHSPLGILSGPEMGLQSKTEAEGN